MKKKKEKRETYMGSLDSFLRYFINKVKPQTLYYRVTLSELSPLMWHS